MHMASCAWTVAATPTPKPHSPTPQNSTGLSPFATCTWQRIWHRACFCGYGQKLTEAVPPVERTEKGESLRSLPRSSFAMRIGEIPDREPNSYTLRDFTESNSFNTRHMAIFGLWLQIMSTPSDSGSLPGVSLCVVLLCSKVCRPSTPYSSRQEHFLGDGLPSCVHELGPARRMGELNSLGLRRY